MWVFIEQFTADRSNRMKTNTVYKQHIQTNAWTAGQQSKEIFRVKNWNNVDWLWRTESCNCPNISVNMAAGGWSSRSWLSEVEGSNTTPRRWSGGEEDFTVTVNSYCTVTLSVSLIWLILVAFCRFSVQMVSRNTEFSCFYSAVMILMLLIRQPMINRDTDQSLVRVIRVQLFNQDRTWRVLNESLFVH